MPKPLQLTRLNFGNLRDKQSLRDRNVQVKYSSAVLSGTLNILQKTITNVSNHLIEIQSQLEGAYILTNNNNNNLLISNQHKLFRLKVKIRLKIYPGFYAH